MRPKAVVLLSGGVDSAVATAIARSKGFELYALSVDYGQRHRRELRAASDLAKAFNVAELRFMTVDLRGFGGSALVDEGARIPTSRSERTIGRDIPATYVPARNVVLLSLGLAWAEAIDADAVFIGTHSLDYSGYPDCRPEFLEAFQKASAAGTKRGVEDRAIRIEAPLVHMSKKEIIERGMKLRVPFELTWSCYLGGKKACGRCDSCIIRLRAFKEAGMEDPIDYE